MSDYIPGLNTLKKRADYHYKMAEAEQAKGNQELVLFHVGIATGYEGAMLALQVNHELRGDREE